MLEGRGDDNAQVLRDNGIATGLSRFNGGQAELSLFSELPVDSLVLDPSIVDRFAGPPRESLLHTAVERMIPLIREHGVAVLVPDLSTEERTAWWRRVEVDAAYGDHLAPAVPGYEL
jgi:EAL domain-containing protein (putative c-di-GMP-specific phosphodiesterase class I)